MEILGIIGHILLTILFVVLIVVACILFLPVVYRAWIVKPEEGDLTVRGRIRWFFGLVWLTFLYDKDGFSWDVRLIGIPIKRIYRAIHERRRKRVVKIIVNEGPVRAKKQPTIRPGAKPVFKADEPKVHHTDAENRRYFKDDRVFGEPPKPSIFEKIALTLKNIYDKMVLAGTVMRAIRKAWPFVIKLLKHIRPRRIEGNVIFGFDDPSATGKALGLIGVVYPFLPEKLEICPDFQEKKFGCDLFVGGHLFLIYVIVYVVKIILIQEIREIIKKINVRRRKNG